VEISRTSGGMETSSACLEPSLLIDSDRLRVCCDSLPLCFSTEAFDPLVREADLAVGPSKDCRGRKDAVPEAGSRWGEEFREVDLLFWCL